MQRTKLMAMMLAAGIFGASIAIAAEPASGAIKPAPTNPSDTALVETKVKAPIQEESTIGRMAAKRRLLDELKLDKEIKKLREESGPQVVMPTTFLPQIQAPVRQSESEVQLEAQHIVTAIFGQDGKLRAEIAANGLPYIVSKGSSNIPGWKVEDVLSNRVVLSNGKRTKNVYISAAAPTPEPSVQALSLPNLPPVGLPSVGGQ